MNIRDFEYFHQLVKEKNFSKVAQNFSVSQPTVTLAIKRLEEEFETTFLSVIVHTKNYWSPLVAISSTHI